VPAELVIEPDCPADRVTDADSTGVPSERLTFPDNLKLQFCPMLLRAGDSTNKIRRRLLKGRVLNRNRMNRNFSCQQELKIYCRWTSVWKAR
jgi:hypothetical protein